MKRKLIVTLVVVSLLVVSCSRSFTPDHAANHKMKCRKGGLK